ncbi:bcl-2-related ovarian killer protein homolog B [Electrophorus electricus]|uniref:Bcl-2 Bcl-2 homology region 1-3 domain-containing protein n=1 Tax=Electrophorus electricus TaxID=8005 RepID=A0A4W4H2R9_ELEEL|nr:bcl-2-related ovarian killer protein homolog B [Electrophorus electricus]
MNRVFFSELITGSFSLTFVAVVGMELFNRTLTDRDLVSQSMMLCRYFMCSRIIREGLSWSKVEPGLPAPDGALGDVLRVLLKLGDELDYLQPYLYRNVAKQLRISVATETMVIDAFLSVATEILSLGITWGKVVAIFAVAGGLAVDCVRQGHPAMLHTIVESLGELVGKSLASWLKKRGGWGDISKCVTSLDNTAQYHWLSAVVSTWRHLVKTMYVYLMK